MTGNLNMTTENTHSNDLLQIYDLTPLIKKQPVTYQKIQIEKTIS